MTGIGQTASVGGSALEELVLTLDPGGSTTGWGLWQLPADEPIVRLDYGCIKGGLDGFVEWTIEHHRYIAETLVVCEKFVAERRAEDLTPLQIEGALIAAQHFAGAPEIVWQLRSRKRNIGLPKERTALLKAHGLWISNDQAREDPKVDWKDARDVNDAAIHALIYAKDWEHLPTLRAYWGPAA